MSADTQNKSGEETRRGDEEDNETNEREEEYECGDDETERGSDERGRISAYERREDGSVSFVIFVREKFDHIRDEIDEVLTGFPRGVCNTVETVSDDEGEYLLPEGQPQREQEAEQIDQEILRLDDDTIVNDTAEEANLFCALSEYFCQSTITYSPTSEPPRMSYTTTETSDGTDKTEEDPCFDAKQLQCQSVDTISFNSGFVKQSNGSYSDLKDDVCDIEVDGRFTLPVVLENISCDSSDILSLAADGSTVESSEISSIKSSNVSGKSKQKVIRNINRKDSPVRFIRILNTAPRSDSTKASTTPDARTVSPLSAGDEYIKPLCAQTCSKNAREERMVPGSNNEVCFSFGPLNPFFNDTRESYDVLFKDALPSDPETGSSEDACFNFSNPDQNRSHQELSKDFADYNIPTVHGQDSSEATASQCSYHPNESMFRSLTKSLVNSRSRYEKLYEIGEGGYGTVYVANDTHFKEKVILKEMELSQIKMEDIAEEIAILDKFPHDKIMKLLDNYSTSQFYYMVFEFQSNVSLFEYLKLTGKLPEEETVYILYQVLDAVEWLHDNMIVHGDIKDENMVITSSNRSIVLIDFGSARILEDTLEPIVFRGTRVYSPPESVLGDVAFGQSLDVWTIGTLAYVLLNNKRPFDDENEIINACIPYPRCWTEGARNFVRVCLSKEYFDRPSVTLLRYHPWIVKDCELLT